MNYYKKMLKKEGSHRGTSYKLVKNYIVFRIYRLEKMSGPNTIKIGFVRIPFFKLNDFMQYPNLYWSNCFCNTYNS